MWMDVDENERPQDDYMAVCSSVRRRSYTNYAIASSDF